MERVPGQYHWMTFEGLLFTVRNSFLHFLDEVHPESAHRRRVSSAPATLGGGDGLGSENTADRRLTASGRGERQERRPEISSDSEDVKRPEHNSDSEDIMSEVHGSHMVSESLNYVEGCFGTACQTGATSSQPQGSAEEWTGAAIAREAFSRDTQDSPLPHVERSETLPRTGSLVPEVLWEPESSADDHSNDPLQACMAHESAGVSSVDEGAQAGVGAESDEVDTVMIKNIPCSCTRQEILDAIEEVGFKEKYHFFYLPTRHSKFIGYAFIGFPPHITKEFAKAMTGYKFRTRKSPKVIEVVPAHIQGLDSNMRHFRNSFVMQTKKRPIFQAPVHEEQDGASPMAAGEKETDAKTHG